ncbi:hypothetical protein AB0903_26830 [Streptomyces sp. NPDC048389]|uniref:hypothetical protein n=1 Tax=Streptomyces sp. NPDC048389 TaxID=3154622 RepID=UPI0034560966
MTDDEVRRRLREAARSHRPDRARILARIERGMAEEPGPAVRPSVRRAGRLRIAGAAAAVVAVLALGGYAVAAMGHDENDRGGVAAPPATPSAPTGTGEGRLLADGSVDPHSNSYWAQSNVTVHNTGELTSLTVELRIAMTGGVESTGNWRTRPAADFDFSVRKEADALVYRWVLRRGRTVPPGRHVFAGQYNHAEGGRDAGGDTYTVRTEASGEPVEAGGGFAPTGP